MLVLWLCCRAEVAVDQHQTPVWEQSYIFNLEGKEEILHLNVWNQATLGDDRTATAHTTNERLREHRMHNRISSRQDGCWA
jgi:hypothetical protein